MCLLGLAEVAALINRVNRMTILLQFSLENIPFACIGKWTRGALTAEYRSLMWYPNKRHIASAAPIDRLS